MRRERLIRYSEMSRLLALPSNLRAHYACAILENLGFEFCVDHGYANAEAMVTEKGFSEDLDMLVSGDHYLRGLA